jgi:tape measure domain-containing protein
MADQSTQLEISVEIEKALAALRRFDGALDGSRKALSRAAEGVQKLQSSLNAARAAFASFITVISVDALKNAADDWTNLQNQVRGATKSQEEFTAVQRRVFQISQRTGTALNDTAKLYGRISIAATSLNASQNEVLRVTDIIAKALAASGTSATEASGALLQLGQALNSQKVQAEEFNSINEAMPGLIKEVERSLGIAAGGMKQYIQDVGLTNKEFFNAILDTQAAVESQFSKAEDTIGTGLTRLQNRVRQVAGLTAC